MTEPAISVVLPTYQHRRFLPATIADIVGQTRADWELIVVDDGSTDGTAEWLDSAGLDARVTVLRQANAGPDAAINAGIRLARGGYVTWISADNRCAPYFLEALAAGLDGDPAAGLAYSPYYAIDANDAVRALKFDNLLLLRELVTGTPRGMAGFLYRRALHDRVGWYEGYACDTRMWARLAECTPSVFVVEPTYYYRFHEDRATVRAHGRVERERRAITEDFLRRHGPRGAAALLDQLYPGLARAPRHRAAAAADASARLFRAGFPAAALEVAREGVRCATPGTLAAPLRAGVQAASRAGLDPLEALLPALQECPLPETARDAAITVALGLATLLDGAEPDATGLLDPTHELCRLEHPRIFSYLAWKAGHRVAPLPSF